MSFSKEEVRSRVIECAIQYKGKLCNKELLFFYFDGEYKYISVLFKKGHYKHLTGIETDLSALDFYRGCVNKAISENQIALKSNGTTFLKLQILDRIIDIAYNAKFLGDSIKTGVLLEIDKIVGNTFNGLGVGNSNDGTYHPKSVLNGDSRSRILKNHAILAVYEKDIYSADKGYTLVRKNTKLTDTGFEEISKLIQK
jgi:hypothetical protein